MTFKIAYCPFCGSELPIRAVDCKFRLLVWDRCRTPFCRGEREEIISDRYGFLLTPIDVRDNFIYKRPNK